MAKVLGCLGALLQNETSRFINWIFQNLEDTKEGKVYFLYIMKEVGRAHKTQPRLTRSNYQFLELAESFTLEPFVPMLILNMQTFLENVQQHEYLIPTVEIIVFLSGNYSHLVQIHFQVGTYTILEAGNLRNTVLTFAVLLGYRRSACRLGTGHPLAW